MPAISAPTDCEISPWEYQSSAKSAPSGTWNVIVGIYPGLSRIRIPRGRLLERETVGVCTLKRGAEAPREVLPIVSLGEFFESVDTSALVAGFGGLESVDTSPEMAGFDWSESVDTTDGEIAGFAFDSLGRPRPRTGIPAALR